MDENNQILDVTYGSFSCRLEGFEDSVETMKMVVSFFHELAGHDLFMDTEPQAPDMATLARLTEEQTGVPVDVESDGNSVSLRVRKEDADAEQAAPEDSLADDEAADEAQDPPAQENEPDEGSYFVDMSSVAGKLQRMRDAATRKTVAPSEEFAEDLSEPVAETPAANPLSQRLSDLVKQTADAAPAATEASEPEQVEQEDGAAAQAEEPTLTEADRASDDESQHDDTFNVFSNFDEQVAASDEILEIGDEPGPDTAFDALEDESPEPEADELEADALDVDEEPEVAEDPVLDVSEDSADGDAVDTMEIDEAFAMDADRVADDTDDFEDDFAEDADEPLAGDTEDDDIAAQESDDTAEQEDDTATSEEPPLVLTSDDDASDEVDHDDYNDDDEFDLEKEVAKVEAEIAARRGNEFARRGLPRHVEDAMSRIMSQTDQHLNQPENRRHRDAFAQLKAAVAATEAARQLGDKGADKRDPDEVYKDDLGAHDAKDRGEGNAAPPLKLVKSQEVKPGASTLDPDAKPQPAAESASPAEAASERLRKIATLKETGAQPSASGFAEFAASHGATDLVDQMEAAGAYICFVQGEDDFSRPQVMKLVQSASNREISREDGLRSFGRLLRLARLVKLPNGRFQIADNSQYRPDGHKAAQG